MRMSAPVTLEGVAVTERALQSALQAGFESLERQERLTWPVTKVTVSGEWILTGTYSDTSPRG